jgi:hypothetical protein
MVKSQLKFECNNRVTTIPFDNDITNEFNLNKEPLLQRICFHENHTHLLRFDKNGNVRNNQRIDVYRNEGETGTPIEYDCAICKRHFVLQCKMNFTNQTTEKVEGVPLLDPTYPCIHIHSINSEEHAINIRLNHQGKVIYAKPVKILKNS